MWTIISVSSLIFAVILTLNALKLINYFQLESYGKMFTRVSKIFNFKIIFVGLVGILTGYIVYAIVIFSKIAIFQYGLPILTIILLVTLFCDKNTKCLRQPLVFTPRVKRLIAVSGIVIYAICFFFFWLGGLLVASGVKLYFIFTPFLVASLPCLIWLSSKIVLPLEILIKKNYIKNCKKSLNERKNIVKIGITGSYAKTSIKQILTDILSVKYRAFCTPNNFNTPMGICKSVSKMPLDTQIFVVEMGAKHIGDIDELCKIAKIDYAILTGVNNQHMSTFKSLDNTISTKMEIAEYAKSRDELTIFNAYDKICTEQFEKFEGKKLLSRDDECFYNAPTFDENGSKFELVVDGESVECTTCLLGEHNIQNILIAVKMAHVLGLTNEEIREGISKIKPIKHRLELQKTLGGITIIDDSYNSNTTGARLGIDCLKMFKSRKIIATQGVVELGEDEFRENNALGSYMANVVDIAIVIGHNASAIKQGLLCKDFPLQNIYVAKDLEMAKKIFEKVLVFGDTLYIQNDLPDNYINN